MRLRIRRFDIRHWNTALKVLGITWGALFVGTAARPFLIRAMLPGQLPAQICVRVAGCGALAVTAVWDAGHDAWQPVLDVRTAAGQLPPDADALLRAVQTVTAQKRLALASQFAQTLAVRVDGRLVPAAQDTP